MRVARRIIGTMVLFAGAVVIGNASFSRAAVNACGEQSEMCAEEPAKGIVPANGLPGRAEVAVVDPARVQTGDLVRANYTLTLEDGSLVTTTNAAVAHDKGHVRSVAYRDAANFVPAGFVAGGPSDLPGISDALAGMSPGGRKRVDLPFAKGFGPVDEAKKVVFPRTRALPRTVSINAEEYVKNFKSFPVAGKEVPLTPYFPGRVKEVGEQAVQLDLLVKDGDTFTESFGTVTAKIAGDEVALTVNPRVGDMFELQSQSGQQSGRIVSVAGDTFTVDFNHPLAGKNLILEVEVVSLVKGGELRQVKLPWLEDHDAALVAAGKENKPVVLVLYASWCGWSKRLLNETFDSPLIKDLRDRFIWAKIDSDKNKEYKTRYAQAGFPVIVLLRPDGSEAARVDGFRDAAGMADVLNSMLGPS